MLDALAAHARNSGVKTLRGRYLPTRKNAMVADHYPKLGFTMVSQEPDGAAVYILDAEDYRPRNTHIKLTEPNPT